jgi:hypothetical protein
VREQQGKDLLMTLLVDKQAEKMGELEKAEMMIYIYQALIAPNVPFQDQTSAFTYLVANGSPTDVMTCIKQGI